MFDMGNGCFFLHHMDWRCREMHGDYCGWHSVNARFYILILKLQTKIIRDKSNYIHDETEKYSKCFLLSSALTPDPATSPRKPHSTHFYFPSQGLLPVLSRCPKACSVNCGGCARQLHGEVHHPISRSPSPTAPVKDPPSLTVLTTYNGINWREIQTS